MNNLIKLTNKALYSDWNLPFLIKCSYTGQNIHNSEFEKPVIIFILKGEITLNNAHARTCKQGKFIFMTGQSMLSLNTLYWDKCELALVLPFEYSDFDDINVNIINNQNTFIADMNSSVIKFLFHYIEWSQYSPKHLLILRRKELLSLLHFQYSQSNQFYPRKQSTQQQVIDLFKYDLSIRNTIQDISKKLAMSESTLRRKLRHEGCNFRELNINIRLEYGMQLLQSTDLPIALISEQCGYSSQSRFSEKFKEIFGLLPGQLRKILMND